MMDLLRSSKCAIMSVLLWGFFCTNTSMSANAMGAQWSPLSLLITDSIMARHTDQKALLLHCALFTAAEKTFFHFFNHVYSSASETPKKFPAGRFLNAFSHLHKSVCPSVCLSVRPLEFLRKFSKTSKCTHPKRDASICPSRMVLLCMSGPGKEKEETLPILAFKKTKQEKNESQSHSFRNQGRMGSSSFFLLVLFSPPLSLLPWEGRLVVELGNVP